ncbi:MAG: hypothetical protein IPM69_01775 [Ignavibacteria bacterium]|nr:hypothetical protein [Ignavibacteria bacterium]
MKYLILLLLLSTTFVLAKAQDNPPQATSPVENLPGTSALPKDIIGISSEFFKLMMSGNSDQAFQRLFKNSPMADNKTLTTQIIDQAKKAEQIYGIIKGFERVGEESLTESFIRLRYISLHDKYPLRWVFTFYKSPTRGWIVTNVKFDDDSEYFFSKE